MERSLGDEFLNVCVIDCKCKFLIEERYTDASFCFVFAYVRLPPTSRRDWAVPRRSENEMSRTLDVIQCAIRLSRVEF
jgi:hypothetical protein